MDDDQIVAVIGHELGHLLRSGHASTTEALLGIEPNSDAEIADMTLEGIANDEFWIYAESGQDSAQVRVDSEIASNCVTSSRAATTRSSSAGKASMRDR